jgi:hypothetical protein
VKLRSIQEQHNAIVFLERQNTYNIGFATQSLLMRAENCIAAGGGNFEQLL